MWNFERIKEEIAGTKDWFSLKNISWDFLTKSRKDKEKEIIRIYYKQNFIDEITWFRDEKDSFYSSIFINSTKMFEIFEEIWVLLVPKTILSNGVVSCFSCYDENLKKMFDTDWVFWGFIYKYRKLYFHKVTKNKPWNLWEQFAIDRDWMRVVREKTKIFSSWNIHKELNDIKYINKEWLYNICVINEKKVDKSYYIWAFFVLLKEILNVSKSFFWDEYTINLEDITTLFNKFWDDYAIAITNKIKIGIVWEKKISQEKYIEFQKLILETFPQLLDVKFNNDDITDNYCSFFLRIENDGTVSNLKQIKHFFKSFPHALYNGKTIIYPTFPVTTEYSDKDLDRFSKLYSINILINENQRRKFPFLTEKSIFYSFLNDKNSYIRKFIEEKDSKEKNNKYKITFFVWMKILEEKYGKWMYILEIKNSDKLRFLREDWTVIFSIDGFPLRIISPSPYNISFNERTWTCFFSSLYWTDNNIVCLNLANSKYKILANVEIKFPNPSPRNYSIEQFIRNKTNNTYFIQPENIFDIDFKKFRPEYVIWKYQAYYFQKTWIRWLNFILREEYKYQIEKFDYVSWRVDKDKAFYWKFSWKWFLSLLHSLYTEIGELTTNLKKPLYVNDNLKIWFFIPLAKSTKE